MKNNFIDEDQSNAECGLDGKDQPANNNENSSELTRAQAFELLVRQRAIEANRIASRPPMHDGAA